MNIRFTMPRTSGGRLLATCLIVVGIVVALFFFAAILIVAAAGALVWFIRSFLSRPNKPRSIRPEEVSAEYEILQDDAEVPNGAGDRLLPGSPESESPASEHGSKSE